MSKIVNYDFKKKNNLNDLIELKKNKKLYVVFSTYGEREADLIYDKISLLNSKADLLIDKIFLSHRRAGEEADKTEHNAKKVFKKIEIVVCNKLKVPDMNDETGKGADMRRTLYHINKNFLDGNSPGDVIIIFLDADVKTEYFGLHFIYQLLEPVLNGFDFSKGSFWREKGRLKKYLAQPLFSVIEHPQLKDLTSFAYPLSGEVGGTLEFFNSVNFWQKYGVETGINIDSVMNEFKIADVNLGIYDHEHQDDINIQKMAFGILRTYFLKLIQYDIIELKDNAKVADKFKETFIDENKIRIKLNFDLNEKMYDPLFDIL